MDLKLPGYEREVVEGLARHGLRERSLVSTMYPESLDRLGELAPALRRGWSVPRVRRNYLKAPLYIRLPALALAVWMRLACRRPAARASAPGGCEAIMSHQVLVSGRLVRAVHGRGGQLYVWTVDEAPKIRALEALGVDGVITNDPRLFELLAADGAGARRELGGLARAELQVRHGAQLVGSRRPAARSARRSSRPAAR